MGTELRVTALEVRDHPDAAYAAFRSRELPSSGLNLSR